MNKAKLVVISALAIAGRSYATDELRLGFPAYGGNGCRQGTVGVTLSPDQTQLSILFDEYLVEAVGRNVTARKSCNIAVPIHVPNGLSLSIFQVDYRGFNALPRGASSVLTSEYFFANQAGPRVNTTFTGALDEDYYVSDQLAAGTMIWSACGADVNLRINSAMRVKSNSRGEQSLATVDSVDLSAGLVYHLRLRPCRR